MASTPGIGSVTICKIPAPTCSSFKKPIGDNPLDQNSTTLSFRLLRVSYAWYPSASLRGQSNLLALACRLHAATDASASGRPDARALSATKDAAEDGPNHGAPAQIGRA